MINFTLSGSSATGTVSRTYMQSGPRTPCGSQAAWMRYGALFPVRSPHALA